MIHTIEERAKELYPDAFDDDEIVPAREGYIVKIQRLAYIEGARVQKQIDIDKAVEWLKENIELYLYNRGGFEEYIPTCGDGLFRDFRKAMEE